LRYHPTKNVLYACTEDITKENLVAAYAVSPVSGELTHLCSKSAMGKSTCYLTIDGPGTHMLFCNYWDSVIGTVRRKSSSSRWPAMKPAEKQMTMVDD